VLRIDGNHAARENYMRLLTTIKSGKPELIFSRDLSRAVAARETIEEKWAERLLEWSRRHLWRDADHQLTGPELPKHLCDDARRGPRHDPGAKDSWRAMKRVTARSALFPRTGLDAAMC